MMSDYDAAIADALAFAFTEEHHRDGDDTENVVDAINRLARAVNNLGNADAATPMGGMEALGKAMQDSANTIAAGLEHLAEAIEASNR
jgi:hypothetical protein